MAGRPHPTATTAGNLATTGLSRSLNTGFHVFVGQRRSHECQSDQRGAARQSCAHL